MIMENFETNTVEVVDMSEICNLLIDNGYRLVRWSGEGADSCRIAAADPILEREMEVAR